MFLSSKLLNLKWLMLVKDTGRHTDVPAPASRQHQSESEEQSHLQHPRNITSATHRRFARTPQGARAGGAGCSFLMSDLVFSLFTHLAKSLQSSLPRHWKFPLLGSWGSFPSVRVGSANGRSCSICDSAAVWGRAVCWDAPTQPKQAGNQEPRSSPVTMLADGAQTEHGS